MALLFALIICAIHAANADEANPLEQAIKATFLCKFELYVTWPARAFLSATSPFNICVLGDVSFAGLVKRAAGSQSVGSHPVAVVHLAVASNNVLCAILYVPPGDPAWVQRQLAAVAGTPVLTVSDGVSDDAAAGVINFVIDNSRVRFAIDNALAVHDGLSISSKLLSIALSVRPAQ